MMFFGWMATRLVAIVLQQAGGRRTGLGLVCASLEFFHSPVLCTVQRFCQLVALSWGYTLSITITMHATDVAQCQEGDCRAGLGRTGFSNTSHCLTMHKSIMLATRSLKGYLGNQDLEITCMLP